MRLTITFQTLDSQTEVKLPLHYNYSLQGFIYRHISDYLANFLHSKGYRHEKRVFRLFTFSRIYGKFCIKKDTIIFVAPIKLQVSSPLDDFLQEFAETLARVPEVSIDNNSLMVSSIEVHFSPIPTSYQLIRMLTPVTIYSTLLTAEGKKRTYYYSPFEKDFSLLIQKNICKKYISFYKRKPAVEKFTITAQKVNKSSEKILKYTPPKSPYVIIKGWMGEYSLEGNPELIRFAYDAGIGGKNSQGFGMFEMVDSSTFN